MAAARILASRPQWSDRAIAAAAGLSAKAVAAIRGRSSDSGPQLNIRIGRDGRVRPLDGTQGRLRASEIISSRPDLSLREIAREAGISVATAKNVRERIRQGRDPLPPRQRAGEEGSVGVRGPALAGRPTAAARPATRAVKVVDWPSVRQKLCKDPAVRYGASGRAFLHWFDAHSIDSVEWKPVIDAVPRHWIDDIAALARSYSDRWLEIAETLERQHRRTA
jgi:hypothetical protein